MMTASFAEIRLRFVNRKRPRSCPMRSPAWCLTVALLSPAALVAQAPAPGADAARPAQGKLVQDVWETAYLDGYRVGYMHLTVEEITTPTGGKFLRAARDLNFTVRRGGDLARLTAVTGTDETPDGAVLGVSMQQGVATKGTQELSGG